MSWSYRLDDACAPNEVAIDLKGGDLMPFDPDNERLGLVAEYAHAIMGLMRQFGNTIDFSDSPAKVLGPPPEIGEHTRAILDSLQVLSVRSESLSRSGVVARRE